MFPTESISNLFPFALQEKEIKAIYDEIRKLKAVIVKQENRIRALEAAQKAQEAAVNDLLDDTDGGAAPAAASLAPDEV